MEMMMTEEQLMERAIELALKGTGFVSPNPRVGAVIAKEGNIISEGWHKGYGLLHAEIDAIENASGIDLENCELYVNLEPCTHSGKTPPCTDAIIEKRFKKVVVGMQDPNPHVSGNGIDVLKSAGIEVSVGILEKECRWINRFFIKHITTQVPYIILKIAQTLDGFIATAEGQSKWLTCEESRRRTHALRSELDAVAVGCKTALLDNPELTVRHVQGRNPKRIVFDSNLSLPSDINLFTDNEKLNTIICCGKDIAMTDKAENLRGEGINVLPCQISDDGKINISEALRELSGKFNIASMLVEGGASLFSAFLNSGFTDEIHCFISPMVLGAGIGTFNEVNISELTDAIKFKYRAIAKSDLDIYTIATIKEY
jgi:diaminohydroxyphosphoribosylaminopyrimidine deaminase / 5-amino-6-(5-phosphoribosylamino)uracil reductase